MIALVDGGLQPKLLSLKEILEYFVLHRQDVVVRRTKFDLNKALDREHILEGLKKALDFIDQVIKTIRASKDKDEAHKNLVAKFKFTDRQAEAILEMRLQTLAGLERKKIEDELEEKKKLIKELRALLADPKKILKVIKDELTGIKDKYGDERRTRVVGHAVKEISTEDLVPEKEAVLVLTQGGYVKITDPESYKSQKRGGVGVIDMNTKEEDFVNIFLTANTHDDLLFFTDKGKVYQIKMYELPEGKKATKGKSIFNYLSLGDDEKVTSILAMPKSKKKEQFSLIMVTKQGIIKKVDAESFKSVRRSGLAAMKLQKGDELRYAGIVNKSESIILITQSGQAVRFKESDIRVMGRGAGGVRGMRLKKSDEIVGADIIAAENGDKFLLTMSKNGFGKKSVIKDYKIQKRGGSGIKTSKITSKTGPLMIAKVVGPEYEELIAISQKGQVIKTSLADIPKLGRQTQGVRIMKLREGDNIASLTCL
jgi:DNA gyrase subunit A